ncbi:peptidoglycan -binding protein [Paracoccus shanxieyensis]|uniref:Peptidoglycan -binding protein n=1 Tax=Paracoccus shanxieyensis TaxID=2675752 RepID=A0A6L6IYX6_9RHOB|nr:peptidoglycan -binding protein [Paracoccus shanxieyensis]MTH64778.1 peptidoglycan -binding protein [Paracoccus shanxieyensis]MTH87989.1 peptidoglycan -binding protein [Paracoccus shanxieyensis]
MGLSSRNSGRERFSAVIWPGFVDAMSTLLLVLIFALTIFMVLQSVLRQQITSQDSQLRQLGTVVSSQESELTQLGSRVAALSDALSTSQDRAQGLDRDLAAERARLRASEAAVAQARGEVDAQTEAARLAAARREALEALIADLRRRNADAGTQLDSTRQQLSDAEAARLADKAAAEALEQRLANSDAELNATALALDASRKKAEETLTLLAAAEAARKDLGTRADAQATEAERQAGLLALAQQKLADQQALSTEEQRRVALLNEQVAGLNDQLGRLQTVLQTAGDDKRAADLRAEDLGQQLNLALVRAADEERQRRALEADARSKAEAEARDLARYRSEFFGRLSQILQGREGVRVVGDRFAFSSEVLFPAGEATLSSEGRNQIAGVTQLLQQISSEIPPEIDWIIRVDGHTDSQPLSGQGRYRDNWELSQARALSVVRYMVEDLGFPANRLLPAGFADTRPVAQGSSPEANAQNRRIELKLTER